MLKKRPKTRLVTIRLPPDLEDAIKAVAVARNIAWQTAMKDLLKEKLGLNFSKDSLQMTEVKHISARGLQAAAKRLRG
jgi:hypothetical protein